MAHRDWDASYASGEPLPWDTGEPDPMLIEVVRSGAIAPCRALDVGCGTGTNALWLASQGFDVLGVDVSPLAVERARRKAGAAGAAKCRFEAVDFLAREVPGAPFGFVFDRGCFHVFDEAEERARFAERVAAALSVGGRWLSLIGSTEGPPRDVGPPRRSARDVMAAIEPALEIVDFRSGAFDVETVPLMAWRCLSRKREIPAQPTSRRD